MFKRFRMLGLVVLLITLVALQYARVPARPTIFTNLTFEDAQAAASKADPARLLVVDFSASWCGPCRNMDRRTWTDPGLVQWLRDRATAVKVDIDADRARARAFGVESVPTVVLLSGTREVGRWVGDLSGPELLERLKSAAARP